MKLHQSGPTAYNTITGYGEDYVAVNGRRHESALIVTPDRVLSWSAGEFADLKAEDFEALESLGAEIVLLGTGPRQRFPHPRLTAPLATAGIGVEVMDLKAACRTYNILVAEERKVAAALMLSEIPVTGGRLAAALTAVAVLLFAGLGARPLYKADESRYAEIPREMAASGDWLTPRLNDLKYFEKPPLQYWATAAFFKLFGEEDWAARLWPAAAAFAGILLVWLWGNRIFGPPAGTYAALVLAGCPLYVMLAQITTLDMGLAFFMSAAMFAFALGRYYVFWGACALAVLSKGLVGIVLPLAAVGLYVCIELDWGLIRKMKPLTGTLLFAAIAAPWFVAVSLANPEFAHFFFVQEHFQRFTTRMHGRYQPAWYFLPILAFGVAPWLLLFFPALGKPRRGKPGDGFDAPLFLLLWALVVLAFFSASSSKLPSYILPMFPALALLLGRWIAAEKPRGLLVAQCAVALAVGAALCALTGAIAAGRLGPVAALPPGYLPWLAAAGAALALLALGALVCAQRRNPGAALALLALGSCACTVAAVTGHRELAPLYSISGQVAALGSPPTAQTPIFAVDFYDHTLPWYFRRPVTMVRYKDELGVPVGWEPQKFIPDLAGFARAWAAAPAAYAVFSSEEFEKIRTEIPAPMEILSRGPRYTIVRKP